MKELASDPGYQVSSFALAVPSLNDIFIRVAGGDLTHTNGQSQHPPAKESAYEPAQNPTHR
jgi:hypothetical protein